VLREANFCDDGMPEMGPEQNLPLLYLQDPPSGISSVVFYDLSGVIHLMS